MCGILNELGRSGDGKEERPEKGDGENQKKPGLTGSNLWMTKGFVFAIVDQRVGGSLS